MFPPTPQRDFRQAEQASREKYARLEDAAARSAQFGIQRPKLRERIRRWHRRLMHRKPVER